MAEVRRLSLRGRLLVMLLATVAGSQLALGVLGHRFARDHAHGNQQRQLAASLQAGVAPLLSRLATIRVGLELVSRSDPTPHAAQELAEALMRACPEVEAVAWAGVHGAGPDTLRTSGQGEGQVHAGPRAVAGWSDSAPGAQSGDSFWIAAAEAPSLGPMPTALIRADVLAAQVSPRAAQAAGADGSHWLVTSQDGHIVWEWPPSAALRGKAATARGPTARAVHQAVADFARGRLAPAVSSGRAAAVLLAVEPLGDTGLIAAMGVDRASVPAEMPGLQLGFWGIMAITSLLSIWLVVRFSRSFSLRIDRISETVHAVAEGDLERAVCDQSEGDDELARLGRAVNAMTASLRSHRTALESQRLRLAEALREVESLDRLKDSFLALVSHEVRTPLTSIMGGIELLNDGSYRDRTADETTLLEIVHDGCKRLAGFMNDAILMASLQASRARTGYEEVSLTALVDGQLAELSGAMQERTLALHNGIDERGEVVTWGDWTLLQVAVRKVLENAVMHNIPGGSIHIDLVEQPAEEPCVAWSRLQAQRARPLPHPRLRWQALRVYNTGPVVPAEKLRALFQRFELVHDVAHHQRGSGLSLPIAAQVLRQHDGNIEVRQVEDTGMAFYLVLPVRERALAADRRSDLPAGIDNLVESALTLVPRAPSQPGVAAAFPAEVVSPTV